MIDQKPVRLNNDIPNCLVHTLKWKQNKHEQDIALFILHTTSKIWKKGKIAKKNTFKLYVQTLTFWNKKIKILLINKWDKQRTSQTITFSFMRSITCMCYHTNESSIPLTKYNKAVHPHAFNRLCYLLCIYHMSSTSALFLWWIIHLTIIIPSRSTLLN